MGFAWAPKARENTWMTRFAELTAYQSKNGGKTPPAGSYTLGSWVNTQRKYRKSNKLSADQIRMLDEVGFAWTPLEESPCVHAAGELVKWNDNLSKVAEGGLLSDELKSWLQEQQTLAYTGQLGENKYLKLLKNNLLPEIKARNDTTQSGTGCAAESKESDSALATNSVAIAFLKN